MTPENTAQLNNMKFVLWFVDNQRNFIDPHGDQATALISRLKFLMQSIVSINQYMMAVKKPDKFYLQVAN